MPKFLHTADLHLNAQRRSFPNSYLSRATWVLEAISQTAAQHDCDCIVVAGDVFDRTDLTNQERRVFSQWLGGLELPLIMISGNHDARSGTIGDTCIHDISLLRLKWQMIHDGDPKVFKAFGCSWLLFPYYGWTNDDFYLILQAMLDDVNKTQPIVVVMHEAVKGGQTDTGFLVSKKQQIHLDDSLPITYWALGDIHRCQNILPNAYYSGAPHQIDFGEDVEKGVLIVNTDAPTEPKYCSLKSPYGLVTVSDVPDRWPDFCRYTGKESIPLPDHVLRTVTHDTVVEDLVIPSQTVPPLWGLEEMLCKMDLNEALIPEIIEMADKMLHDTLK